MERVRQQCLARQEGRLLAAGQGRIAGRKQNSRRADERACGHADGAGVGDGGDDAGMVGHDAIPLQRGLNVRCHPDGVAGQVSMSSSGRNTPSRPAPRLGWSSRTKCPTSNHHRSVFFSAFVMRRPRSSIARADPSSTVVCCWTVVVHDRAVICYRWLFAMPLDNVAPWYFSPIPSATSQCARHWIAA